MTSFLPGLLSQLQVREGVAQIVNNGDPIVKADPRRIMIVFGSTTGAPGQHNAVTTLPNVVAGQGFSLVDTGAPLLLYQPEHPGLPQQAWYGIGNVLPTQIAFLEVLVTGN